MRRRRASTLFVLVLVVLMAPRVARADAVDDYVAGQMKMFHLPGLSLAVVKNGTIVKAAGYGVADVERRTPATADTVYRIGSVSKQYIATAVMLLERDGGVALDDPISKYLRGTPDAWRPITIRHLLTHTSGLVRESPVFNPFKDQTDAAVVEGAYGSPLQFAPGAKWAYSNVGYSALGEIIRVASDQPWSRFIEQRVFKPAGLVTTAPTNVVPSLPNRATGYTGNDNARAADDWLALRPSGAFLSTVRDLARWDAVLSADTILDAATRRRMWTPVRLNDGSTYPYGFGWHVETWDGRSVVWHGGGQPGFGSQFLRFLDEGLTLIVLVNGNDFDMGGFSLGLSRLYLPKAAVSPTK